jgi:hypothetical protein
LIWLNEIAVFGQPRRYCRVPAGDRPGKTVPFRHRCNWHGSCSVSRMSNTRHILNRRALLSGLAAAGAASLAMPLLSREARAGDLFSRIDLRGGHDADLAGLLPDAADDQSRLFQRAINEAAAAGRILRLPPGSYVVSNIDLPDGARITGVPGATRLIYGGRGHFMLAEGARRIELSGLTLDGANQRLGEPCDRAGAPARRQRGGSRGHGDRRRRRARGDAGSLRRAHPPLRDLRRAAGGDLRD